jgi:hypothetical protein
VTQNEELTKQDANLIYSMQFLRILIGICGGCCRQTSALRKFMVVSAT